MDEYRATFSEEHLKNVTLFLRRVGGVVTLEAEGEPERKKTLLDGKDEVAAKRLFEATRQQYEER